MLDFEITISDDWKSE